MYGQFHNEQMLSKKRTSFIPTNEAIKGQGKINAITFISLLLITISISSPSFAGPSQPKLKGGNGNAQGR